MAIGLAAIAKSPKRVGVASIGHVDPQRRHQSAKPRAANDVPIGNLRDNLGLPLEDLQAIRADHDAAAQVEEQIAGEDADEYRGHCHDIEYSIDIDLSRLPPQVKKPQ